MMISISKWQSDALEVSYGAGMSYGELEYRM